MIKVVLRQFFGREKYKDFHLCYVDAIPETVFDLTPESKAWERSVEYRTILMNQRRSSWREKRHFKMKNNLNQE